MYDHDCLLLLSNKLSKLLGIKLIITFDNKPNNLESSIYKKYRLFIVDRPCYIFTKGNGFLTERELMLIQYLLAKEICNISDPNFKRENLTKIITEDLIESDKREIIKQQGISIRDSISVILINPLKDDLYEEIIYLISNIEKDDIQVVKLNNKYICMLLFNNDFSDIKMMCEAISYAVESELLGQAKIGVGGSKNVLMLNESYEEAKTALEIGTRYQPNKNIYYFRDLTIYSLISSIEEDMLKKLYNKTIEMNFHELNEEEIKTANTFIENDLKLSQTAKALYIHRNTLLYRLEKINKTTTLDIRTFNDAMEFKVLSIIYRSYKYGS